MLRLVDESVRDLWHNPVTGARHKTIAVLMELHRGTLRQHYRQHGRSFTATQKLLMCQDLLRALLYIWQNGLVHLDVKFENVLVADDGRLVLSDFGTAQRVDANGFSQNPDTEPLLATKSIWRQKSWGRRLHNAFNSADSLVGSAAPCSSR
jgi:serine/threonine protein kinase